MKTLYIAFIGSLCVSCSTAPQFSLLSRNSQDAGKAYTVEAYNMSARQILKEPNRKCPAMSKDSENKTWREVVGFAATCAAQEKWAGVEILGQQLADRFPVNPWGFYFMSLAADARGDMGRAFWMLEQASDKDRSMALFPYQRGRIYLKNGETESAVVEFEKALKLDSSLFEADLFLGQIRLRGGNMASAERSFRNVLKFEPFHREALMGAARCLVNNGDSKLALDFLERIISKDKRDYQARFERALILETMYQKYEEALTEYQAIRQMGENKNQIQKRIEDLEKTIKAKKAENDRKVASAKSGSGK